MRLNNPIPEIESAYLNLGTADGDIVSAQDAWEKETWPDTILWINEAIHQLESARAKIERHVANQPLAHD